MNRKAAATELRFCLLLGLLIPLLSNGCSTQSLRKSPSECGISPTTSTQGLVVLPLFARSAASAFPLSERNLITAAHAIEGCDDIVVVGGRPVLLFPTTRVTNAISQSENDWRVLSSTIQQFEPNIIDTDVVLEPGRSVIIGGYPGSRRPPYDAAAHARAVPTIIHGTVIGQHSESPFLIDVRVPRREYRGVSGGPAAVIDDQGKIRVWGVAIEARRGPRRGLFGSPDSEILTIIKLQKESVRQIKNMRMIEKR